MNPQRFFLFSLFSLLLLGCVGRAIPQGPPASPTVAATATQGMTGSRTLVLGDVGDELEKFDAFEPLGDYLAANLSEFDIGSSEVRLAADLQGMAEWLQDGEVDIYFDSVYPALWMEQQIGAQPILYRRKDGVAAYNSVLFTLADGPIQSVDDLDGKVVGFSDPYSTSGFMLPYVLLTEAGQTLEPVVSAQSRGRAGVVGYVHLASDNQMLNLVLAGTLAAGAFNRDDYAELPEETRSQLRLLAESEEVPRHVALVRPDMPAEEVEAIRTLLLGMSETEEGRQLLATFEGTTQFDPLEGGSLTGIERLREMYELTSRR